MTLLPIILPQGFIVKVSINDKLTPDTVIAEKISGKNEVINLSSLGLTQYEKVLKKNIGDSVRKGEVVAVKPGKLGIGSKKITSDYSGIISKIDTENGKIYIKLSGVEEEIENIFSPVVGSVDFCNNEKIVIKTDKEALIAKDGIGKKGEGEAFYIEDPDFNRLTSQIENKVVLISKLDKISLFKILGLDASGVITEEVEDLDFIDLDNKKIIVPILSVSEEDFKKAVKNKNKRMFLDGENKSIIIL
jgi:hypothetical protein